jgi:FKBP-type peptidyl-prolyl cis-trans isomerase FklB
MNKISYALGLSIGNNFLSSGIKNLEIEDFIKGIDDVFSKKTPEISYEEAKQIVNDYFMDIQNENIKLNKDVGKEFLRINGKNSGVVTLPSGLQYEILRKGNGVKPKITDKVKCHYHGTLVNGMVFDSSVQRREPAVFGVSQVIQGWIEALQLMETGSKWKLFIPSELAYGKRGAGDIIAPDSTLIFEIELLDIV